jgi:hypothetical protein
MNPIWDLLFINAGASQGVLTNAQDLPIPARRLQFAPCVTVTSAPL